MSNSDHPTPVIIALVSSTTFTLLFDNLKSKTNREIFYQEYRIAELLSSTFASVPSSIALNFTGNDIFTVTLTAFNNLIVLLP